jgi:hypothetical protein
VSLGEESDWAHGEIFPSEQTPLLLLHPRRRVFAGDAAGGTLAGIMEKVKNSRLAYWADKLAVESEPGLTNAQVSDDNTTCILKGC